MSELTVRNFCIGTLMLAGVSAAIMVVVSGAKEAAILAFAVALSRVLVYAVWP